MKLGKLYGIGVGPGDPELMTLKAVRVIKDSHIIVTPNSGKSENVAFNIAKSAVEEIELKELIEVDMPMTRDRLVLKASHEKAAETIISFLKEGKDIAFLTLGDPSIYSTYTYVHKEVLDKGYDAEIIPGVPSFCAVSAKLNDGLVEGGEALHILPASYKDLDEGLSLKGTKILMKSGKAIKEVRDELEKRGLLKHSKMVEKCGMTGERVFESINNIDETSYFSIIVVKEGKSK